MLKFKKCKRCGLVKGRDEFYVDEKNRDGLAGSCKICTRARIRANRRANKAYYQEYDRKRNSTPERKKATYERYRRNGEKYPEKRKAHDAVHRAVKIGKLIKQPCEICGAVKVHAHHEDYSRPLDVIWLCSFHHHWIHS